VYQRTMSQLAFRRMANVFWLKESWVWVIPDDWQIQDPNGVHRLPRSPANMHFSCLACASWLFSRWGSVGALWVPRFPWLGGLLMVTCLQAPVLWHSCCPSCFFPLVVSSQRRGIPSPVCFPHGFLTNSGVIRTLVTAELLCLP